VGTTIPIFKREESNGELGSHFDAEAAMRERKAMLWFAEVRAGF
jgi:hypothetical protein